MVPRQEASSKRKITPLKYVIASLVQPRRFTCSFSHILQVKDDGEKQVVSRSGWKKMVCPLTSPGDVLSRSSRKLHPRRK